MKGRFDRGTPEYRAEFRLELAYLIIGAALAIGLATWRHGSRYRRTIGTTRAMR